MDSEAAAAFTSRYGRIQASELYVDAEGEWFHRGTRIFREEIIGLFIENLCRDENGAFFIRWNEGLCSLKAADTPLVVARVDRVSPGGGEEKIQLGLKYCPAPEQLDPSTLCVGKDNVLYCRVRGGSLPARFSRPAYYELARWIEEDPGGGSFYLEIGGARFPISPCVSE